VLYLFALLIVPSAFAFWHGYKLFKARQAVAVERTRIIKLNLLNPRTPHDLPPTVSYSLETYILAGLSALIFASTLLAFEKFKPPESWFYATLIWLAFGASAGALILSGWFQYITYFEKNQEPPPLPVLPPEPEPEPPPEPPKFEIPDALRLEHTLVLGGTGVGKTQLLSSWIAEDLRKPCTLVVFDSQGDLIHKILRVRFPRERAVVIDPTDVDHPIALSLFDFNTGGDTAYEREKNFNSVVELLLFVLESMDSSVTAKQRLPLEMLIRLCLVIEDATIHTLLDLLTDDKFKVHAPHIGKLSRTAQEFFKNEYMGSGFKETREQIRRRIYSILSNTALERMFSAPRTKLNMREILDNGSVVLINTARSFLKDEGSAFFTRFITALIFQAIQERDPGGDYLPVFLYIDEAAPVMSEQTSNILETGRKYKLGLTLAFQSLGQIPKTVEHSVISNTSIKAVCGISAKDARALADDMHTEPEALMGLRKLEFFTHLKGGQSAVIDVEYGSLDRLPKRDDLKALLRENRERFAADKVERIIPEHDDSRNDD